MANGLDHKDILNAFKDPGADIAGEKIYHKNVLNALRNHKDILNACGGRNVYKDILNFFKDQRGRCGWWMEGIIMIF